MIWTMLLAEVLKIDTNNKTNPILIPNISADDLTMNNIIVAIYMAIAGVAVFYILRGALLYVTNSGNPADVTQARTTIAMAVVALIGSTLVFAMVQFVIETI